MQHFVEAFSVLGSAILTTWGIYLSFKGKQSDNVKEMSKSNYDQLYALYQEVKEESSKTKEKVEELEVFRTKYEELKSKYDDLKRKYEDLKQKYLEIEKKEKQS